MEWKDWKGKTVFIKLKDGTCYSKSHVDNLDEIFIHILDRDNIPVSIALSEIIKIVEDSE